MWEIEELPAYRNVPRRFSLVRKQEGRVVERRGALGSFAAGLPAAFATHAEAEHELAIERWSARRAFLGTAD